MDLANILQDIGFTRNEAKVYLTLLRLGSATSYHIVKEAHISSGKIYETLYRLMERGIVSTVTRRGRRYFSAAEPECLIDFLKQREHDLAEDRHAISAMIPTLKAEQRTVKQETRAELYEGIVGIKTVYERMLRETQRGATILIAGAPRMAGEKLDGYFDDFNQRRIAKNVRLRIILNTDHPRERKLSALPKTAVRVFPRNIRTPAWIIIFNNTVATLNIEGVPIVFLLQNAAAAASYRQYFTLIWNLAKLQKPEPR